MNILNQSDLSNRPVIKYIIIALIAANAVILALLLFGPERLIPAASPFGSGEELAAAGSTVETAEDSRSPEKDDDRNDEDDKNDRSDKNDKNGKNNEEDGKDENIQNDEDDKNVENDESIENDENSGNDDDNPGEADTVEAAEEGNTAPAPVLELVDDHITLKYGSYFNFYEYIKTMQDIDGSDLSHYIHLQGEVNTYMPGDYTVTYQITSQINGETTSKDLLVTVEY
jgi:hypothetical protein